MLELHNILNKMDAMLQQLSEILQAEQMILIENNLAHTLSHVIDEKSQLLIELKLLDDQRVTVGKQFNIESPYTGYDSLATKWNEIVNTTALLAKMNRDNGTILQTRMDKTQQTIAFFNKLNNASVYTNVGYQQTDAVSTKRAEV